MLIANQDSYTDKHGWATIGGIVGAVFTVPHLVGETIGQVDLLRNVKGLKPILKDDTFEYLKKSTNSEIFEHITRNKKILYNPLLKRLGIASLCVAGGVIIGGFLDDLHRKHKYMP